MKLIPDVILIVMTVSVTVDFLVEIENIQFLDALVVRKYQVFEQFDRISIVLNNRPANYMHTNKERNNEFITSKKVFCFLR